MGKTKLNRPNTSMNSRYDQVIATHADTESLMSGPSNRERWQALINQTLILWLDDPAQISDEGIEPPSRTIIRLALDYAESLRDEDRAPADRIMPDPNGGIIISRASREFREVIHIWEDGTVELYVYFGHELKERRPY